MMNQRNHSQIILPLGHYRLSFRLASGHHRSVYSGSAWRGGFGRALKKTVCVTQEPVCNRCHLYRHCAFPYIFDTPPPATTDRMRRYNAVPHPFALRVGDQQDELLLLHIVLIGAGNMYLQQIVEALRLAGSKGVSDAQWSLLQVEQEVGGVGAWHAIYSGGRLRARPPWYPEPPTIPDAVQVVIDKPLRLRREQHYVTPERFVFRDLFSNLLRRVAMLQYFHADRSLVANMAELVRASGAVSLHQTQLRWEESTRYSSRQKTTMKMGGLVGDFRLCGDDIAPFWPYLWLGQWVQAGKGTSMGLGVYRLVS